MSTDGPGREAPGPTTAPERTAGPAAAGGAVLPPGVAGVLGLQGAVGNRAVSRMLLRQDHGDAGVQLPGGVPVPETRPPREARPPGEPRPPGGMQTPPPPPPPAQPAPAPTPTPTTGPTQAPAQTPASDVDAGPGAPTVRNATPTDATSGVDWAGIWDKEGLNIIRTGLEVTRLVPAIGLWGGLAADSINAYQDITSVPEGKGQELMQVVLAARHVVNAANNAVGAILYVDQLIQDGLAGSIVGAEFVPITYVVNEIGTGGKLALDGAEFACDAWVTLLAYVGRQTAATPEEAAAYQGLLDGYQANMVTDLLSGANDLVGVITGGASQSGGIDQASKTFLQIARTAKWAWPAARSFIISLWNVWGSKFTSDAPPAAAPAAGVARAVAGQSLQRAPGESDPLAAFAWDVAIGELMAMRGAYEIGDALIGEAAGAISQRVEEANQAMTAMLDGRQPFEVVKELSGQILVEMNARLGQFGEIEALSMSAEEQAAMVRQEIQGVMSLVQSLVIPVISIPKADVGEGVAADVAEAVIGAGTDVANAGIELLIDQVREAVESGKAALTEPLGDLLAKSDEIGQFIALLSEGARMQIGYLQKWIADLEAKLGQSEDFPQMFEALINQALGLVGIDSDFKFQDIADGWHDLGPMIDEAIAFAERRAAANRGGPAPAPDADAQPVGSVAAPAAPEV